MTKIAMMFGKGLDGCGVQRGGVEFQNWAEKNGIQFDIYSLVERTFARAKGHSMSKAPIEFKIDDIENIAAKMEEYDIVILNSYPSHKHKHSTIISFYDNFVCKIKKPILVGMMHEIRQPNIDCYPLIIPTLNRCDIVYNFSETTWFSKSFSKIMPSKIIGERTKRFSLWMDIDDLVKRYKEKSPILERNKRLIFVGRWTTMKDPKRILDLEPLIHARDKDFDVGIFGIEKSIGAKYDIIDQPNAEYLGMPKPNPEFFNDRVAVYGPYVRDYGMQQISDSLFAASFYYLPKDPENYGDRMEYSQIEIISCGAIPVFDKHFGQNNKDSTGTRYVDNDYLAIWSDKSNLEETTDQLMEVSSSDILKKKYSESSIDFVSREFASDKILPKMIEDILKTGKDENKFTSDEQLINHLYDGDDRYYKVYTDLLNQGTCPAVGFRQLENNIIGKFIGKKREEVELPSKINLMELFS